MKKIEKVRERLRSVDLLQTVKRHLTYNEISEKTGISAPSLSRYVKGHVLPSYERARKLIKIFKPHYTVKKEILQRIDFSKEFFNIYPVLFDSSLMERVADYAKEKFRNNKPEKVISVAIDGIPLAVKVAEAFKVPFTYAKRSKEMGVQEFYELAYPGSAGILKTIYLPKGSIGKNEKTLLVDDIVKSGKTMEALINLVEEKAKARVVGVFSLVGFEKGREILNARDIPSVILVKQSGKR